MQGVEASGKGSLQVGPPLSKKKKIHMGEGGQKIRISSYKIKKSWNVTYSMVTIVSNTVLHI